MSDESKPYPASDLKLERLRDQGDVPYSPEVDTAAIVVGLTLVLLLFVGVAGSLFVEFAEHAFSFSLGEVPAPPAAAETSFEDLFSSAGNVLFFSSALVLLPIVFLVVISGLVQTRFLFTPSALGLRFARLVDISALSVRAYSRRFLGSLVCLVLFLSSLFLGWLLLQYFFSAEIASEYGDVSVAADTRWVVLRGAKLPFLGFIQSVAYFCLGAVVAVSIVFACGGYFIRVFRFRAMHRMSRAELEAEYREMGPSPELLSARKDQLNETD